MLCENYWSLSLLALHASGLRFGLGKFFLNLIATKHHAHSQIYTKPDSRSDAPIEPLQPMVLVNILGSSPNVQFLRSIRILRLALHLNSNHFNRLIPTPKRPSNNRSHQLFGNTQLSMLILALHYHLGNSRNSYEIKEGKQGIYQNEIPNLSFGGGQLPILLC
jgi:hypothetical protein